MSERPEREPTKVRMKRPTSKLRVLAAFGLCPFLPIAILLSILFVLRKVGVHVPSHSGETLVKFALVASIGAVPAVWLAGIPAFFWMRRQRIDSLQGYLILGACIATLFSIPFLPIVLWTIPVSLVISGSMWVVLFGFQRPVQS